jgi:hypothetical protein
VTEAVLYNTPRPAADRAAPTKHVDVVETVVPKRTKFLTLKEEAIMLPSITDAFRIEPNAATRRTAGELGWMNLLLFFEIALIGYLF